MFITGEKLVSNGKAKKKICCNIKEKEIRHFGDKWLFLFLHCVKKTGFLAADQNMR